MIKVHEINRADYPNFLNQLLDWGKHFDYQSVLNSNDYEDALGRYEILAAFGDERLFQLDSIDQLKQFYDEKNSWLFGHFSYDLKNQLENLNSRHHPKLNFGNITFFEPSYLFLQKKDTQIIEVYIAKEGYRKRGEHFFNDLDISEKKEVTAGLPSLNPRQPKEEYIKALNKLKSEIQYGNIYEINYCQEFYSAGVEISPIASYQLLNRQSSMPFSAFYRNRENYLICASPERFICKRGSYLYSQPIKGTAKRGVGLKDDETIKGELKKSLKEQTENVMIVDLVRNDLSRTAKKGSVQVEELFGVYSFPQVHQLISTVRSELSDRYHFLDAIKYAFPMGSMTGAPKISAMDLADKYEHSRRELYSGAVGYIDPNGDFDFNVVIRSLLYSAEKKYLSLTVGGAITDLSDPESEYEECLLKAKAIFELQNNK